jgi:hypothetical protein
MTTGCNCRTTAVAPIRFYGPHSHKSVEPPARTTKAHGAQSDLCCSPAPLSAINSIAAHWLHHIGCRFGQGSPKHTGQQDTAPGVVLPRWLILSIGHSTLAPQMNSVPCQFLIPRLTCTRNCKSNSTTSVVHCVRRASTRTATHK